MSSDRLPLHPFSLELDLLDRMMNFEIADDPNYSGLEIQAFDDSSHGKGMLVFFNRRTDDKTDVYYEAGLKLDQANYAIGSGLGAWVETEFRRNRLEVSDRGVNADILFTDAANRAIEVRAGDYTPRGRRSAAFLAPMGAAITSPTSLPLIWMSKFDLLRRSGPTPVVLIDGRAASLGHLPAEPLTRRRLVKVTTDLCAVAVNSARSGVRLDDLVGLAESVVEAGGTRAVVGRAASHEARFEFDPCFPDLGDEPRIEDGTWTVFIDRSSIVGGTWQISRADKTKVRLDVTQGWKPSGLPALMRIVTRVAPVFRTWPTTYRWEAEISDDKVMTSAWERTGAGKGESYRKLTGSA